MEVRTGEDLILDCDILATASQLPVPGVPYQQSACWHRYVIVTNMADGRDDEIVEEQGNKLCVQTVKVFQSFAHYSLFGSACTIMGTGAQ